MALENETMILFLALRKSSKYLLGLSLPLSLPLSLSLSLSHSLSRSLSLPPEWLSALPYQEEKGKGEE